MQSPIATGMQIRNKVKGGAKLPHGSKKIPMVDLPLGATEDRVCGTIDIEKALTEGEPAGEAVWMWRGEGERRRGARDLLAGLHAWA
jgi:Mg-chelatase subunit ChlI